MALTLITAPTIEPITVAEAKAQLLHVSGFGEPIAPAPTAALAATPVAGNVDNGAHRYAVTFVTADGETSIGDISDAVTVADKTTNGKVELTAIALGGSACTSRNMYRTAAGGSTYLKAFAIANNTATTATDNVADSSLGAEAPTTNTTEDPILTSLIIAVRERAELSTRRAMLTQTWDLILDSFPGGDYIEIPKPPTASITDLKYNDSDGDEQTWTLPSANCVTQLPVGPRCARARLALAYGVVWPATRGEIGDVTVRFVAGATTRAGVPYLLKVAMKMDLAHLYANRESVSAGTMADVPQSARDIYNSYRSW